MVHTAWLPPTIGGETSFLDKLLGRSKQAAGDLKDDPEMKSEGMHQEAQGAAEDRAEQAEDMAQEAATTLPRTRRSAKTRCRQAVGAARVRRPDAVRSDL